MNWLMKLRESKMSKPTNIILEYDWEDGTIHFLQSDCKGTAPFSTNPDVIKRQVGFIAALERVKVRYLESLRENYGDEFANEANRFADAFASREQITMTKTANNIRMLAKAIIESEFADEDATTKILIEDEINNLCNEQEG